LGVDQNTNSGDGFASMIHYISNQKVEIDIHNMYREEAKRYLERFLSTVNGSINEVVVIHGYASGTVLQKMVRSLRHKKIKQKILSLNPGITTYLLG
jgi:Mismatch repair ATPase (MutS family)